MSHVLTMDMKNKDIMVVSVVKCTQSGAFNIFSFGTKLDTTMRLMAQREFNSVKE